MKWIDLRQRNLYTVVDCFIVISSPDGTSTEEEDSPSLLTSVPSDDDTEGLYLLEILYSI